jgi:rhodanese-related sulfurtransferase
MNTINASELKKQLDQGAAITLLEALPLKYYQAEHLPGAVNLPLEKLEENAPRLLPRKDAALVVYCASSTCENSDIAARALKKLGYTNVTVFPGGKAEWKHFGYELAAGAKEERVACACA